MKIALGFRILALFRSFSEFHKSSVGVYFGNYECQFCVDKRRLLRQIWLKLRPWEIAWQLEISEFRKNEVTDAKNVQEMLTFHFLAHFEMTKITRCEFISQKSSWIRNSHHIIFWPFLRLRIFDQKILWPLATFSKSSFFENFIARASFRCMISLLTLTRKIFKIDLKRPWIWDLTSKYP